MRRRWTAAAAAATLATTSFGGRAASAATTNAVHPAQCGPVREASVTGLSATGRVVWRTALPRPNDDGTTPPLAEDSTVYADLSGGVTAIDAADGRIQWSRSLGTDVYGEWLIGPTLVVDVDQVVDHPQIVGLNPKTGAIEWRCRNARGWFGNPVPAGDTGLVLVAGPHRMLLLDTAVGRVAWQAWMVNAAQPVADATTMAVDPDGTLFGYAVATGKRQWAVAGTDTGAYAAPTLDAGVVALGAEVDPDNVPISGYELSTGRRAWTLPLDAGSWALIATPAGLVATGGDRTDAGGLDLIDPATGRIRWRETIGHPAFLQNVPVVDGDNLAMVVNQPQDGPSYVLFRSLAAGLLVANHRLARDQVPLGIGTAGVGLYGTGLGDGRQETGFVERLSTAGVAWRVVLPQPAQTTPVALPGGGIAIQTEDLICVTVSG